MRVLGLLLAGCALGVAASSAGARRAPPPDSFRAAVEAPAGCCSTLALTRSADGLESWVPERDSLLAHRLEQYLAAAGYRTLPPDTVRARWELAARAVGGTFDPRTGRRVPAMRAAAMAQMLPALRESFGVEFVLCYDLRESEALNEGLHVRWDGADWPLIRKNFMTFLIASPDAGQVTVTSLRVRIFDMSGRLLYERRGGLMPLERIDGPHHIVLTPEQTVQDPVVVTRAMARALSPWLERVPAGGRRR